MIPVYKGYSSQYGYGLGNVLGGLVRAAIPHVSKLAKSAGAKLIDAGLDFVAKKVKRKAEVPLLPKAKRAKRTTFTKKANKRRAPPRRQLVLKTRRRKEDII